METRTSKEFEEGSSIGAHNSQERIPVYSHHKSYLNAMNQVTNARKELEDMNIKMMAR